MDPIDCKQSYTYLLSNKDQCMQYVAENKDTLCADITTKNVYSEICSPSTTQTATTSTPTYSINQTQTEQLFLLGGFFGVLIISYIVYLILDYFLDRQRPLHLLKIKFNTPKLEDEPQAMKEMQGFFASIHSLLTSERLSFEIHKTSDYISLILSSPSTRVIESTKKFLTGLQSISIEETDTDPLLSLNPKYQKSLILSSDYGTIDYVENELYSKLVNYLTSLDSSENISIIFNLRAISKIESVRKKIHQKELLLAKNEGNLRHTLTTEIEQLEEKISSHLFQTGIVLTSSKPELFEPVVSLFKAHNGRNTFVSQPAKKITKAPFLRFIPKENILTTFFRKWFGSYLNSAELSSLFHPSTVDRSGYRTQQNLVIEASPDFMTDSTQSIHIGKSKLKTGKTVDVFFPVENLERHIYLAGKTGMGKSTLMILLYLSLEQTQKDKALMMLDPHGSDLVKIALRTPDWSDLIYFNISDSQNASTFTFNPLFAFQQTTRQKESKLEQIMKIFEEESGRKNKDLGTSIEKILSFLIETALHFPDAYFQYLTETLHIDHTTVENIVRERQLSFPDLPHILKDETSYTAVMKKVFANYNEEIAYKWKKELSSYQLNKAILDGVDNRLKFVVKSSLAPLFEGHDLNIIELIKQKKRLLIPITEQSFGVDSKKLIAKFLLAELWNYTQSITDENERQEVVVFIDEFQEAQLEIIDSLLAQARKYKIRLVLGNQYLGQLWDNIRQSVMGNVSTFFAFNIGNMEEAKLVPPLFKNKIEAEDVASLPPFHAYLRTLNPDNNKDVAFMSFETIDYRSELPEYHTMDDLQKLNDTCLETYGQPVSKLKQKHMSKLEDAAGYFLNGLK